MALTYYSYTVSTEEFQVDLSGAETFFLTEHITKTRIFLQKFFLFKNVA